MKKTLKKALSLVLATVFILLMLATAGASSDPFVRSEQTFYTFNLYNHSQDYIVIHCGGDFDTLVYNDFASFADVEFIQWYDSDALFGVSATGLGADGYFEFNILDAAGYVLDTAYVFVECIDAAVVASSDVVSIIPDGINSVSVGFACTGTELPAEYHLTYTAYEGCFGLEWNEEWNGNSIDLTVTAPGPDLYDIVNVAVEDDFGNIYAEENIVIFSEECYDPGNGGDVNLDGKIGVDDARLCLRAAIKLDNIDPDSEIYSYCDTDFDGKITVSDARTILRRAIGFKDASYLAYDDIIRFERAKTAGAATGYALFDINGDEIYELILNDGGTYRVYTTDYFDTAYLCGYIAPSVLKTMNGKLIEESAFEGAYYQEFCEISLNGCAVITEGEFTSNPVSNPAWCGEKITFTPIDADSPVLTANP